MKAQCSRSAFKLLTNISRKSLRDLITSFTQYRGRLDTGLCKDLLLNKGFTVDHDEMKNGDFKTFFL